MKLHRFFSYINYFLKLDKKNTIVYLLLKAAGAAFLSAETVMIAFLLDNMMANMTNGKIIVFSAICLFALWAVKRMIEYAAQRRWIALRKTVFTKLPEQIVQKRGSLNYLTLENRDTQELVQRIGNETEKQFCEYFENNISLLVSEAEILGLLIVIAINSGLISLILLSILIPYIIFSVKNGQINYEAYEESEELFREADYYQSVINKRKYVEERTLFQYGSFFNEKWSEKFREAIKIENRANWKVFFRTEITNIASTVIICGMFFVILCTALGKTMSIGFLISIMKSLINYIDKVSADLARKISKYEKGTLFFTDLQKFMELGCDIKREKNSVKCPESVKSIEFREVSFSYPGSDKKVFEHLNLCMTSDRQYAIVGENGAGKSTLLKLLMGIYTGYSGTILINGIDIRDMDTNELQKMFAYVPQDITRYELPLNEYLQGNDKEKINHWFKEYGINFIEMKDKWPILGKIEENAVDLSGGQWQLLSIVRASLSKRSAFLLDEPTSAIDPIKEAELYYLFQKSMQNEFTILITHRLGAAKMADEIIVISDGKVIEKGSHNQLLDLSGIYYSMYNTQRKWYEADEK